MKTTFFEAQELNLPGVLLVTPKRYDDLRGFSMNRYDAEQFAAIGITTRFVQDFMSCSKKGVIRGFHYQRAPHTQDKLVRVSAGSIFDVVIDHDPSSPTYGRHASVNLDADTAAMLYIPGRYAHGYAVTSGSASIEYKLSDTHHPESADGIRFDEPVFGIVWPVAEPVLSDRDASWPYLTARHV